jgi:hypothetical protein
METTDLKMDSQDMGGAATLTGNGDGRTANDQTDHFPALVGVLDSCMTTAWPFPGKNQLPLDLTEFYSL